MSTNLQLSLPTLVSVVATRGMMGVGAGILLAPRIDKKRRRAIGLALLALGLASTIPIAVRVFGSKRGPVPAPPAPRWPGTERESPSPA